MTETDIAIADYCRRHGLSHWRPEAALIDMDGVLYDSMPGHAHAWKRMMEEEGVPCTEEEFFLYEGMTGKATIEMLMRERMGRVLSPEEIKRLYARKTEYFKAQGPRKTIPGADRMLRILIEAGITRVLVTGSGQPSLLTSLEHEYPGAFLPGNRVTALDVQKGKPDPEPYLMGLQKAGCDATKAIVIENAPLGVEAGHASGCFTVGLTTGPVPRKALEDAGADLTVASMPEFADLLPQLLRGNV